MRRREFERLVVRALGDLPPQFRAYLDNVVVLVEDRPSRELLAQLGMAPGDLLYGYYEGTPLTEFGRDFGMRLPDRIYIFQGPIEEVCRNRAEMEAEVQATVLHEIGHHFGLSEEELEHL